MMVGLLNTIDSLLIRAGVAIESNDTNIAIHTVVGCVEQNIITLLRGMAVLYKTGPCICVLQLVSIYKAITWLYWNMIYVLFMPSYILLVSTKIKELSNMLCNK